MNPSETNIDTALLLATLESFRTAAIRGDPGVSETLKKFSERNDSVGAVALEIHGKALCDPNS